MVAVLGWLGSILYLINHAYISMVKNWQPKIYYAGNLVAAVSLVVSSVMISSYQAVLINGFWALVSVLLLVKFDVSRIPLSKRFFFFGFGALLFYIVYLGVTHGVNTLTFYTYLGWSSSYVFCLSYLLFCSKKLSQIKYLAFNFYAASALLPILWSQENWPVFTLEVCWALISLYGVYVKAEAIHLID